MEGAIDKRTPESPHCGFGYPLYALRLNHGIYLATSLLRARLDSTLFTRPQATHRYDHGGPPLRSGASLTRSVLVPFPPVVVKFGNVPTPKGSPACGEAPAMVPRPSLR
eukprot:2291755-Prymnesium_polylepis.1